MARPRYMAVLMAGFLLPVIAPRPFSIHAQTTSTAQSSTLSYDDLAAAARRADAEKEAAAQKHGKKAKSTPSTDAAAPVIEASVQTPAPTSAPPASSPVSAAISAVAPADTAKVATETPAPATTAEAATPAPAPAEAAAPATAAVDPAAAVQPAADGTVPSAVAAADATGDGAANASGEMPKVAPKMQRTLFGKMKPVKEKAPKLIPITVVHGELTVDGLIAKAGLNFQITDMKFFYIWVPGLGTTIVSNQPFPGSQIQESALNGSLLTVNVDGHQLQLACDRDMLGGKKPKPLSVFVALDKNYDKASIYPEFGFGTALKAPYNWPGTLADLHPNTKAPPLPENLRQNTQSVKTCPKNVDGTQGPCHTVEVPMVLGKTS